MANTRAHFQDLRVRTLSSILAALGTTDGLTRDEGIASLNSHPAISQLPAPVSALDPAMDVPQIHSTSRPSLRTSQSSLKLLNQVALLLVREHEVVGIVPKRSGPKAIIELLVATDSDTDSPDADVHVDVKEPVRTTKLNANGYVVVRTPHKEVVVYPNSDDVLNHLGAAATEQQVLVHLNTYRNVSFGCHLASIELLLNNIISAPPSHRLTAQRLFTRYVTFRSVHKMCRRFKAPAFQSFLAAIREATNSQISAAVGNTSLITTDQSGEYRLIGGILFFRSFDRSTCPDLVGHFRAGKPVEYAPAPAFEFHQILLFALDKAMDSVYQLSVACKATNTNCMEQTLTKAGRWMSKLHQIVHSSPIFQEHMRVLEDIVSKYEPRCVISPDIGPMDMGPMFDAATVEEDNDEDNGPSDEAIEISAAQDAHRVAHEPLWLAVSYREAINSVTNPATLPRVPLKLTLWEPPAGIAQRTPEMEPWIELIQAMYPEDPEGTRDCITCGEVIDALQDYARVHGGKSNFFLRTSRFRGCYHAEAMLATLVYHGFHRSITASHRDLTPSDNDLTTFQHTYRRIGVSKRCCPICTKLLFLLSASNTSRDRSFRVLSAHKNIYPTALPPFVPEEIAEALIEWLQGLVRTTVEGLVKKRRRESNASDASGMSHDSKGDSPGHQRAGEVQEADPPVEGWSMEGQVMRWKEWDEEE
ncbi:hypothetical protein EV426DRAFT_622635 [Tirmania nivea]|nr:hypothetical protein EV426DRAFT_622635 [Tirmania nivea]